MSNSCLAKFPVSSSQGSSPILQSTPSGLYCPAGDFFVDPHRPVDRAVVSHAHSDHARRGCRRYLAAKPSETLIRMRMSADAELDFLPYGQSVTIGGVNVSFVPAGHMLGSAQVRLEYRGRVAVVTGDYKLDRDPTCAAWQPVDCDLLVTESTFGLPVYRWPSQDAEFESINQWWDRNRRLGKCSVLYGYAVGKSQRLLAGLNPDIGPIYTHGAVENGCEAYRRAGIPLPPTTHVGSITGRHDWSGAIVLAVPSSHGTPWLRKFGRLSTAMASGWMAIRGTRRRRSVDRGFVISDHVDWPSLIKAVELCDPETVWVTHGYAAAVARYLREGGRHAMVVENRGAAVDDEDTVAEIER